jgi:hypothetical protein
MKLPLFAVFAPLLSAGCATSLPPDAFTIAADPAIEVRPTTYSPVVVGYSHREPVDPESWRGVNKRVSPAPPGGGS